MHFAVSAWKAGSLCLHADLVTAASRVIEMEDVLDARIVWTAVTCEREQRCGCKERFLKLRGVDTECDCRQPRD